MEKININKGFKLKLAGIPDSSIKEMLSLQTVAVCAMDIPYIRPKLLVKENERVLTGAPVFCDKRDPSIQYVSPATGKVKEIRFGKRRRLQAVVIECEPEDEYIGFDQISSEQLPSIDKPQLVSQLKTAGLWQSLRQFPSKDTANPDNEPSMIIVSVNGNDIFSPDPGVLTNKYSDMIAYGIDVLKHFSHRIVVTVRESHLSRMGALQKIITHTVPDMYPSWDPGVVLYHLKTRAEENTSWCIGIDHLIMIAQFLSTGRYPVEKMMTISKTDKNNPHVLTRQGASIKSLINSVSSDDIMTSGQFNGRLLSQNDFLGFFENTINIIPAADAEMMFGFVRPGFDVPTVSKTFFSSILPDKEVALDATLHGEERACINCSYCENICPNDLMPQFIMKALVTDEIEEALQLGMLDCSRCGLCAYTCPSKIELATILSEGIDDYYLNAG